MGSFQVAHQVVNHGLGILEGSNPTKCMLRQQGLPV